MSRITVLLTVVLFFAAPVLAQDKPDESPGTLDPKTREELKKTYRQAMKEAKKLSSEFQSFYQELKEITEEEGPFEGSGGESGFDQADITDLQSEIIVRLDMPGVKKEDITVRLKDQKTLEVAFMRRIQLPHEASSRGMSAKFEDGILTIRIVKEEGQRSTRDESIPVS